jgi:hypothetical protein
MRGGVGRRPPRGGWGVSYGVFEDGCNELRLRVKAVITKASSSESQLILFYQEKTRQRPLNY